MSSDLLKQLSVEDISWVGSKLKGDYLRIKISDRLTEQEKGREIELLVHRAKRFGFEDLIGYMGWTLYKIPLRDHDFAEILYPMDITPLQKQDMIEQMLSHLEALKTTLKP